MLSVAGGIGADDGGAPATWVSLLELARGLLLLLVAGRQVRSRARGAEGPAQPLDEVTPGRAAGAGALLSSVNPKNPLLAVAAGAAIAQTGTSTGGEVAAYAVFNAVIMAVLLLVIGVKLVGDAISGLSA